MWCTILEVILIYFSLFQTAKASLDDVTSDVGLAGSRDGVLAAFGDFNSDKNADLFLISNSEDYGRIHVYLWDEDEFKKDKEATVQIKNCFITNVIPGDFDGDGYLDTLVAYHNLTLKDDATFVKVFLGKKSHFEIGEISLPDVFVDQPAIVDFNGDLQPDLLGEKKADNKRYWWQYIPENKTFQSHLIPTKGLSKLSKPHSCGFLDLNGDDTPDLFIPTSKHGSPSELSFEVWLNEEGNFNVSGPSLVYDFNQTKGHVIGQSTFADIDSDGIADHLLPVCDNVHCEICVYDAKAKWIPILTGGTSSDDLKWKFIKGTNKDKIPFMTLRIGDYNLDGYPDAAAIIELIEVEGKKRIVVLFKNVDCSGSTGCFHGRKLSMVMDNVLSSIDNPVVFGFFDLYENGILDLFIVSSNDTSKIYQIHAIENTVYSDTCFLKVIVLGGSCFSSCPSGVTPYGVNQAGPFVKYVTTGPDGDTKKASATQLSQAAYFALQPPYTVFGLGRTPNFVEKLIIGLPRSKNSPKRRRTWTSIIPNSQVIIIPIPPDEPDEWKSKLLVTPSRLVLLTGGALLATCVFIGAIVALLHWKEKREDRREKKEAAHKFHFDAM